jgi:hypothetical protein
LPRFSVAVATALPLRVSVTVPVARTPGAVTRTRTVARFPDLTVACFGLTFTVEPSHDTTVPVEAAMPGR